MKLTQARVRDLFDYREDGCLIWKMRPSNRVNIGDVAGHVAPSGYLQVGIDGKLYLVHRVIYLFHKGYMPKMLDHADHNHRNNKIDNLRKATKSQNGCNRGAPSSNTSGFKGVSRYKGRCWRARITTNGKETTIGYFKTKEEAANAYESAVTKHHGDFARAS